jgi:hypothetical protein
MSTESLENKGKDEGDDDAVSRLEDFLLKNFPVELEALPREYREKFEALRTHTVFQSMVAPEMYEEFSQTVLGDLKKYVTELPDLVRVSSEVYGSLLKMFLGPPKQFGGRAAWGRDDEVSPEGMHTLFHECIRYLIEKNPYALGWYHEIPLAFRDDEDTDATTAFELICESEYHAYEFLPWIIENYSSVLAQPNCLHFELVKSYARGYVEETSLVRRFYEQYPEGLHQQNEAMSEFQIRRDSKKGRSILDTGGRFAIHYAASTLQYLEPGQEDYDLFEWMADQNPNALNTADPQGRTILHQLFISRNRWPPYANIIINKCPELIFKRDKNSQLPIHCLSRIEDPRYDDVLIRMLRRMFATHPLDNNLLRDPFVLTIHKILSRQFRLSMNAVHVRQVKLTLEKAMAAAIAKNQDTKKNDDPTLSEVHHIYDHWSVKQLAASSKAITAISEEEIPKVRVELRGNHEAQGEDESEDDEEMFVNDDDH